MDSVVGGGGAAAVEDEGTSVVEAGADAEGVLSIGELDAVTVVKVDGAATVSEGTAGDEGAGVAVDCGTGIPVAVTGQTVVYAAMVLVMTVVE